MLRADAVFEGGGVKGIGIIGAVCYMEEKGYKWQRLAGTSVGALIASLLSVGYSGREVTDILHKINFADFADKGLPQSIPIIGKTLGILIEKGIYSGDKTESFLDELYRAKGKNTFKDLSINGKSRLKVVASDITSQKMIVIPDDLSNYGIDPMSFKISKAIRMSIGIPYFFRPIVINVNKKPHLIVDGGLMSNFPVWIFDVKNTPRWPTLGFKLKEDKKSKTSLGKRGLISYTLDIISTALDQNERIYLKNRDYVRTISIPTNGVRTIEFNITPQREDMLFKSGYYAAEKFLRDWNFEKYLKAYRVENITKSVYIMH